MSSRAAIHFQSIWVGVKQIGERGFFFTLGIEVLKFYLDVNTYIWHNQVWWGIFMNSHILLWIIWTVYDTEFLVPQIEYPLGGSSKRGSHVNFLLIVAMVLLLWHQIVLLWHQVTMGASEQHLYQTIVLPRKLTTGSIHDYLFCYCPLVCILFEVLRIQ